MTEATGSGHGRAPAAGKPWFARKRWWAAVTVVVLLVVAAAVRAGGDEGPVQVTPSSGGSSAQQSGAAVVESAQPQPLAPVIEQGQTQVPMIEQGPSLEPQDQVPAVDDPMADDSGSGLTLSQQNAIEPTSPTSR